MVFFQKFATDVKLTSCKELFIPTSAPPSSPAPLTLIGTVHSDLRGAATLVMLLAALKPDQLTVEISPNVVTYRQTDGLRLLRKFEMILTTLSELSPHPHPDIAAIRNLLELPYEFRVAKTYALDLEIPLHAIDEENISLLKLQQVEGRLISEEHLQRIAAAPRGAPPSHGHRYDLARKLLSSVDAGAREAFLRGCRGVEGIGPRDRHLAKKIRGLLQSLPGHLVHVGGWVHLIDDPVGETLYSLLLDLNPQRILLDPDHPFIP